MTVNENTALLTVEERAICQRVRATGEAPHNQRANALLALDEGLSQTEAGERAGLTAGQVKYWVNKFKQQRMDIFPETLQVQPTSAQSAPVKAPEKESKSERVEKATEEAQPIAPDGKKLKKSKKTKGKKKKSSKKKKDSKKKAAKKAKDKKKKDSKKKKSKKIKKNKK